MEIVADLHMHSTCSDGKYPPSIILDKVVNAGLSTFALSDHDTIDHIPIINTCIKSKNIEIQFIPATEITCEHEGDSIHILAYYQNGDMSLFLDIFNRMNLERKNVIRKMGLKLNDLGYDIDFEAIIKITKNPGRPHLGNALIKAGYFNNLNEVFDQVLGHNKPGYVKKNKPSANIVINKIRDFGGISILAHPGVYGKLSKIENITSLDLDGIEVYHPDHNRKQTQYYLEYTQKHNLLVSGGSDFHGWGDKNSVGSFGIGVDYLNNINEKLN